MLANQRYSIAWTRQAVPSNSSRSAEVAHAKTPATRRTLAMRLERNRLPEVEYLMERLA